MSMKPSDQLILINLPSGKDACMEEVLVHEVSRSEENPRESLLVLCDGDGARLTRSMSQARMENFGVKRLGTLENFFHRNSAIVGWMTLQGAARHGSVTMARAVFHSMTKGAAPAECLAHAILIDQSLRAMNQKQQAVVKQLLSF